jgi:hypothetical protein
VETSYLELYRLKYIVTLMSREVQKLLSIILKLDIFVCYITKHVIHLHTECCCKRFTRR